MIKRLNKVTSLVVAAAAVASLVPATGAMAAEKIADKEGTIYKAVAFKDGKFYIDGEDIEDAKGNNGVFFLEGGKYTEVDTDIDSGDTVEGWYGEKYAEIEDGDYYLDLETGKVTDDNLRKDDREDAASELRKKIRKDDPARYDDESKDNIADADQNDSEIWEIPAAKFSAPYYEVSYLKNGNQSFTVYTDAKGKYIDADNDLGKVNLIVGATTTTAESVSFTEVGTKKNKAKDEEYKIEIIQGTSNTLGSDDKYIYREVALTISQCTDLYDQNGKEKKDEHKDFTTMESVFLGSVKNPVKVEAETHNGVKGFKVIQKISKEQGSDDIDDAKLPKATQTYFTTEYKDFVKKGEAAEARDLHEFHYTNVSEGKINNFGLDSDDKFNGVTFSLTSKNGFYYLNKEDGDIEVNDLDEYNCDTDVNGNIWVMTSGKIYRYKNNGDFELVYKVDGGLNELSVYDEKNLIAYNEDDDIYAIIGGKSSTGIYEEEKEEVATSTGWVQNADGTWNYLNAEGKKVTGWLQSPASGLWYYMDANGVMMSNGWVKDNGTWYYLTESGAMKTGWLNDRGTWYYLQANGAMKTGWLNDNGTWYYLNASGAMLANTTVDGYVLGANGAWIK